MALLRILRAIVYYTTLPHLTPSPSHHILLTPYLLPFLLSLVLISPFLLSFVLTVALLRVLRAIVYYTTEKLRGTGRGTGCVGTTGRVLRSCALACMETALRWIEAGINITSCQHTVPIHTISIHIHPINITSCLYTLLIQPLNTPYQHTHYYPILLTHHTLLI